MFTPSIHSCAKELKWMTTCTLPWKTTKKETNQRQWVMKELAKHGEKRIISCIEVMLRYRNIFLSYFDDSVYFVSRLCSWRTLQRENYSNTIYQMLKKKVVYRMTRKKGMLLIASRLITSMNFLMLRPISIWFFDDK